MKLFWCVALLSIGLPALAQQTDQARPENNSDLRGTKALFIIEDKDSDESVQLDRTGAEDFFAVHREGKEVVRNKLGRAAAEALDEKFSAVFLQVQYEMAADPKGCDADWRLVLRGDEYSFCPKNEQKNQAIRPLFSELRKASAP